MGITSLMRSVGAKVGVEISRYSDPFNAVLYQKLIDQETLNRKPFVNVGSGSFWHPYWTNIDFVSDHYRSVQRDVIHFDLMDSRPLPFNDGSLKIVYTSHTIEHVKDDAVQRLFNEAFRTLEPGGVFRITTGPDAETDYRALMMNDLDWFYWDYWYASPEQYSNTYHRPPGGEPLAERWLSHVASALAPNNKTPSDRKYHADEIMAILKDKGRDDALEFFTSQCDFIPEFPGNHVSWWTHDKIFKFLERAGFITIYRSGHNQSRSALMRHSNLFDSTHPQMSIYVEAVRE